MTFGILGPLQVEHDGANVSLGSPKERALLALLLLDAGRVVSIDRLAEALWGEHLPNQPVGAVRVLVSRLRRTLARAGLDDRIRSAPPGYLIAVDAGELDASEFERRVREGSALLHAGDHQQAAEVLRQALGLWRGDVLADVDLKGESEAVTRRLVAERTAAVEQRIEAELGCGRARSVVGELEMLVEQVPLRESLWVKLVVALARCGRPGDAMVRAAQFREVMAGIGLEPSPAFVRAEDEAKQSEQEFSPTPFDQTPRAALPRSLAANAGSVLVGRAREVGRLVAAFDEVVDGDSTTVLVSGEPGVGKTSLVREAATSFHGRGATVLYGRCDEDLDVGYQPIREALQGYLDAVGASAARVLLQRWPGLEALAGPYRRVLEQPPARIDAERDRMLIIDAVDGWLRDLARERPVVLVVDDLHWAGPSTAELVRHVVRQRDLSLLCLLIVRDTDGAEGGGLRELLATAHRRPRFHRLALHGLDRAGIAHLIAGGGGPEAQSGQLQAAARIHDETGGNPLFATQLIGHLLESDRSLTSPVEDLSLPEGVLDVIRHRLARLSPAANQVLRIAATIGQTSPFALLAAVRVGSETPTESLLDALDEAVSARLLVETPDAEFSFVHNLVRRTVYDSMSAARRVRTHRAVGTALLLLPTPLPDQNALLAHHACLAAGPGDGDRAARYCLDAGLEELAQASYESALRQFERGVDVLERHGPANADLASDLWCGVAEACLRTYDLHRRDRAAWRAVDAARASGSSERLGRAAFAVARAGVVGALDPRIEALCEEALERLGPEPSPTTVNVTRALATLRSYAGEGVAAQATAQAAVDMARATGDPLVLVSALEARVTALAGHPDVVQRMSTADEMVALAERCNDRSRLAYAHYVRAIPRLTSGDREGFDRDFAAMTALARRTGDGYLLAITEQWRAAVAMLEGRFAEAEPVAGEAVELAGHDPNFVNGWAAQVMWLRHEQGRLGEVLPLIEAAAADNPGIVAFRAALALAHAEAGSAASARRHLGEMLTHARRIPQDWLRTCTLTLCAEVTARLGEGELAAVLEELLVPYAGQLVVVATGTHCQGAVDRYRGTLALIRGDCEFAERLLSSALVLEEEARATANATRTRVWYARALVQRGEVSGLAEELAREAAVTAARLGMPGVLAEARDLIAACSRR